VLRCSGGDIGSDANPERGGMLPLLRFGDAEVTFGRSGGGWVSCCF